MNKEKLFQRTVVFIIILLSFIACAKVIVDTLY